MFVKLIWTCALIRAILPLFATSHCPDNCQCKMASENNSNIRVKCGGFAEKVLSNWKQIDLQSAYTQIVSLDLSNNAFTSLQSEDFQNLTQLKRLDFSSNMLRKIDKETFSGVLPNLERLKLSGNSIRHIYFGSFDSMPYLKHLDLSNNPLVCNCDLIWIITFTNERSIKLQPSPKCDSPVYFKGTLLKKLKVGVDLHCESPLQTLLELVPAKSQIVFEGDELVLKCRAPRVGIGVPRESEDISTQTHIFWGWSGKLRGSNTTEDVVFNDPLKIFDDVEILTRHVSDSGILNSILKIVKITKHHSGLWNCTLNSRQADLSKAITLMVITKDMKYCKSTMVHTNKGTYFWPQALLGEIVRQACAENESEEFLVTYTCNQNGEWENLETSSCQFMSETTRILEQFSKMNSTLTKKNAVEIAERLYNFTRKQIYLHNIKDPIDLHFIVLTLKKYMDYMTNSQDISSLLLSLVSELLALPAILFVQAQDQFGVSVNMLNVVELLSSQMQSLASIQKVPIEPWALPKNIYVEFFNIHVDSFTGISCIWPNNVSNMGRRNFECSTSNDTFPMFESYIDAAIQIPVNSLFDEYKKTARLMIAVFRNANLFSHIDENGTLIKDNDLALTSVVIGAKISNEKLHYQPSIDIEDKILIMLRVHPYHNEKSSPIPAWWDSASNDWNIKECRKLYFHRGLLLFTCSRLGYYGILQSREFLNDYVIEGSGETFKFASSSIYVGSFIVFFCSWINIVTFIMFRKAIRMNRQQRHSLVNIWISISCLSAFFSIGIYQTEYSQICRVIGILLHYFSLSVLLWLCVCLSNLYKGLSKNFLVTTESHASKEKLRKPIFSIYLVGWGIGMIICGISTAVNINEYAAYSFCFLHKSSSFNAFLVPAVILLIFLGILILCIYCHINRRALNVLAKKRFTDNQIATENIDMDWFDLKQSTISQQGNQNNATEIDQYRSLTLSNPVSSIVEDFERSNITHLRAHLLFLILFIASWISAALYVYGNAENLPNHRMCSLVFVVSCAFLGVFLILFYTLSRNDTRSAWGRRFKFENTLQKSNTHNIYNTNMHSMQPTNKMSAVYDVSMSGSRSNSQCSRHRSSSVRSMKSNSHKNEQVLQNIDCPLLGTVASNVNQTPPIINNHHMATISLSAVPITCEMPSAEIFYNPNQIIVARKFFKKQKRLAKRNNFELQRQVDRIEYMDNVSDISSLTGSENANIYSKKHNAITLLRGGSKVSNTNIYYKSNNILSITRPKTPNHIPMESFRNESNIPFRVNSDCSTPRRCSTSDFVANIYTNIPETKEPKHEIIKVSGAHRSCKPICVQTLSEHEEGMENEQDLSDEKQNPLYQNTLAVSPVCTTKSPSICNEQMSLVQKSSSLSKLQSKIMVCGGEVQAMNSIGLLKFDKIEDHKRTSRTALDLKTDEINISNVFQIANEENDECSPADCSQLHSKLSKSLNSLHNSNESSNNYLKYKHSNHSLLFNLENNRVPSWIGSSLSMSFIVNANENSPKSGKLKQIKYSENFESACDNVFKMPQAISPTNESDLNYQNSEISIRSHGLYEPQPDNDLNITLTEEFPYQSSSTSDTDDHLNDFDDEIQKRDFQLGQQSTENDPSIDELYEAIKSHNNTLTNKNTEITNNILKHITASLDISSTTLTTTSSATNITPQPKPTFSSDSNVLANTFKEICNDTMVEDDSSQSSIISYIDKKLKGS